MIMLYKPTSESSSDFVITLFYSSFANVLIITPIRVRVTIRVRVRVTVRVRVRVTVANVLIIKPTIALT